MLDEPSEGIQPSIIEEIVDLLRLLRRQRGLTMLLVEQNVDFIKALSDRVLLIQKGRGSIWARKSPFLTCFPSVNAT